MAKAEDLQIRPGPSSEDPYEVRRLDPASGTWSEWIEQGDFIKRIRGEPGYRETVKRINELVKADRERDAKVPAPIAEDLTLLEKRDRLRAYLQQHPGTRLMDLELHQDAERGPLFLLAKKLLQRGELLEHPKTRALSFKDQRPAAELAGPEDPSPPIEEITVRVLKDVPEFAGPRGKVYSAKKEDVLRLPASVARALMRRGAAEEVLTPEPKPEGLPTAALEASGSIVSADQADQENEAELARDGITNGEPDQPPLPAETLPERSGAGAKKVDRPATNPQLTEAESLLRFQKLAREKGEEVAIEAKREEEAPRIEARERKASEEREADEELLRSGGWWDVVDGAIDEFLAGEPQLRKAIVYSALSAGTHGKRLHLMAIGDSQVGKSYALRSIGSKLFPELFIDVAAMSAKALYYAADEAGNPHLFDGKILFVDELADQGDGTLDFIKSAMSNGAEKLTSMTVDEHRKSKIQALEGLPIIWSTSAEVLEDAEGQIMNRPFVVNPDETAEQTRKILDFQRDAVSVGLLKAADSHIPRARRLLARILEEKEFTVYNLFARHVKIKEDDARARNTLPMFFNLVDAITYANRYARPVIELPDGRKLLFASWEDNREAAELWGWASGSKSTGLPNRHIELLKILPVFAGTITGGMELDEIVDEYKKRTGRPVSHKTLRNYLSDLSSKDKATYYEDEDGRHLWYSTSSSHTFPTASQLLIGIESEEGNKLLDEALQSLEEAISQFPNEIRERTKRIKEELLKGCRGA